MAGLQPTEHDYSPSKEAGASNRLILEQDIQFEIEKITQHKTDSKKLEQEIKDRLSSNAGYAMAEETVKESQKAKKEAKKKAFKDDDDLANLDTRLKGLKEDKRQHQMTLSDYLVEFKDMTSQSSVEVQGQLFDFEVYAKLKLR